MHTRLQLDVTAQLSLRDASNPKFVEIFVSDPNSGDASMVIELSRQQLAALCEEASVQ
uniref:hypothetical protein n=1 Tax=Amycolatopsis sp. CA-290885 TaxID=3239925 RepID=UPI003F494CC4